VISCSWAPALGGQACWAPDFCVRTTSPAGAALSQAALETEPDFDSLVTELNAAMRRLQTDLGLTPAPRAHELTHDASALARLDRFDPLAGGEFVAS